MKILKILLYIIVALVVIFIAVNAFLPGKFEVEKSVVIDAKAVDVFEQVNNFKNWKKWSPWQKMDPTMKVEYSGPINGTGATMSWVSADQNVGVGSQTITKSIQGKSIDTKITFAEWNPVDANWQFDEKDGKTTVAACVATYITAGYWFTSSTSFANPAVAIARTFTESFTGINYLNTPTYIIAELIGALIAIYLIKKLTK